MTHISIKHPCNSQFPRRKRRCTRSWFLWNYFKWLHWPLPRHCHHRSHSLQAPHCWSPLPWNNSTLINRIRNFGYSQLTVYCYWGNCMAIASPRHTRDWLRLTLPTLQAMSTAWPPPCQWDRPMTSSSGYNADPPTCTTACSPPSPARVPLSCLPTPLGSDTTADFTLPSPQCRSRPRSHCIASSWPLPVQVASSWHCRLPPANPTAPMRHWFLIRLWPIALKRSRGSALDHRLCCLKYRSCSEGGQSDAASRPAHSMTWKNHTALVNIGWGSACRDNMCWFGAFIGSKALRVCLGSRNSTGCNRQPW